MVEDTKCTDELRMFTGSLCCQMIIWPAVTKVTDEEKFPAEWLIGGWKVCWQSLNELLMDRLKYSLWWKQL